METKKATRTKWLIALLVAGAVVAWVIVASAQPSRNPIVIPIDTNGNAPLTPVNGQSVVRWSCQQPWVINFDPFERPIMCDVGPPYNGKSLPPHNVGKYAESGREYPYRIHTPIPPPAGRQVRSGGGIIVEAR